jgi:hypothetical protein
MEPDGIGLNPFEVIAAKKLSAMETERFFAERRARANDQEFLRILNRKGGEPPRPEDTLE